MKLHWLNKRNKLLQKFSSVREKDLKYRLGREKEMLGRLRKKLGKTEEELLGIIIDL